MWKKTYEYKIQINSEIYESRKSSLAKHQKANIRPIHKREIFELLLAEGLINSTWYLKISNMTLRPAGKQGLKTDLPSNIILNCRNLISADTRGQMLYTLYNTLDMCAHIHTYKYIFNSLFTNDSLISLQTVWIHFHLLPESLSLLPVDEKTSEDISQCQFCSLRGWLKMRVVVLCIDTITFSLNEDQFQDLGGILHLDIFTYYAIPDSELIRK